jgi:hypothetical protein
MLVQKFTIGTFVPTYVVSYGKLVANSSTTKAQSTGLVHARVQWFEDVP